jgi:membrane-bound serine protease (ClpP class)
MAGYLERGLELAARQNASVVILQLDTPGGSVDVTNAMVSQIRSSAIPVVVYVSPRNAMAASAGTIITLAGHLAAMAPETTIGAASPVGAQGEDIGETLESKVKEMLKASVRSLTSDRSDEARQLAEETIESARAVTAGEALNAGLVDLIADDLDDLLEKIDGTTVRVLDRPYTLETRNAEKIPLANTFIEEVLNLLVNPNLVFLLLAIGVQAILIELSSPGGWVAGFIGVVCLLLATYGLGILPVNWFGLLFLLLAFVLFILEITTPTIGVLTAAGAVSFITGALILFNTLRLPGFPGVSVPLVVGTGIFLALSFFAVVTFALRAQRSPIQIGRETLAGSSGETQTMLEPRGVVLINGEQWGAEAIPEDAPILPGTKIEVVAVEGLRLKVRKQR